LPGYRAFNITAKRTVKETPVLSAPTFVSWIISTVIAGAIILLNYLGISVPIVSELIAGRSFEFLLGAYVLLWLGTVFRGL
jgi:hypothetical protein